MTEEGAFVLDVMFYAGLALDGEPAEYQDVYNAIRAVPGVTAIGISIGQADAAVVCTEKGLNVLERQQA